MNFGTEIIRDMIGETLPHHRGIPVLNIAKSEEFNLCVCYGISDGAYTQFFVLNCDENHHVVDPAFYDQQVYYHNRMFYFDYDYKGVMNRLHLTELCPLPSEVAAEEEKRCKKYLTDNPAAFIEAVDAYVKRNI